MSTVATSPRRPLDPRTAALIRAITGFDPATLFRPANSNLTDDELIGHALMQGVRLAVQEPRS